MTTTHKTKLGLGPDPACGLEGKPPPSPVASEDSPEIASSIQPPPSDDTDNQFDPHQPFRTHTFRPSMEFIRSNSAALQRRREESKTTTALATVGHKQRRVGYWIAGSILVFAAVGGALMGECNTKETAAASTSAAIAPATSSPSLPGDPQGPKQPAAETTPKPQVAPSPQASPATSRASQPGPSTRPTPSVPPQSAPPQPASSKATAPQAAASKPIPPQSTSPAPSASDPWLIIQQQP